MTGLVRVLCFSPNTRSRADEHPFQGAPPSYSDGGQEASHIESDDLEYLVVGGEVGSCSATSATQKR